MFLILNSQSMIEKKTIDLKTIKLNKK